MNKFFVLTALCCLALTGCDAQNANAQASQTAQVGNPDSANVMIIEEEYEILPLDNNSQSEDWSKEGNVEVAPLPEQSAPSNTDNKNPSMADVNENIAETITPNTVDVKINEVVND